MNPPQVVGEQTGETSQNRSFAGRPDAHEWPAIGSPLALLGQIYHPHRGMTIHLVRLVRGYASCLTTWALGERIVGLMRKLGLLHVLHQLTGQEVAALRRLTNDGKQSDVPVRSAEYVEFIARTGEPNNMLSLSPAPTGVQLLLLAKNNEYLVIVRDDENPNRSPFFKVGAWTDDPADVWGEVGNVMQGEPVIRKAFARGRSRDDRFKTICDILRTRQERGDVSEWAYDIGIDGFWIKFSDGHESARSIDEWWDWFSWGWLHGDR